MCGIVGYIGNKQALPILLGGLRRLEYRGYDSAGICLYNSEKFERVRQVGKIENLVNETKKYSLSGNFGIAHTRWATHGGVTEENAHPHYDCQNQIVLAHNGIIENYREIQDTLKDNHTFRSETDSEVLAHLIEENYHGDLKQAVEASLKQIRGTYGLVVMHKNHPNTLIAARMGSPLVIGLGEDEYYLASDATPMLAYTKKVVFLEDGELAEISRENLNVFNLRDEQVSKDVQEIEWDAEQAQKSGFDHFMLKEIHDQPAVFLDAIRGRVNKENGTAHLGGLNMTENEMRKVNRIVLIACGTASYAAMVAKYMFERLANIPTEVDVASEFRYRDPLVNENTLVFSISQSGETADTLAALREAKRKGAFVRGIVNVIGSTIARETDGGTYMHAGPELAVASTKAYTNMLAVLFLYALQFGRLHNLTLIKGQTLINELFEIPEKMQKVLNISDQIKSVAEKYKNYNDFLFLGRGINFPVSLEGSHKLKEISYIHSEAYPAGEMKHGMNALLSEQMPVFGIITKNQLYDKMRSNIEEVRARKSKVILLANENDEKVRDLADDIIFIPEANYMLEPILNTIPLQLFAYHAATLLGRDVDRPRNLAKSVTVE